MHKIEKTASILASLVLAFMSACTGEASLCAIPEGSTPMSGVVSKVTQIFKGGAVVQPVCTVQADTLKPKTKYTFSDGLLVVNGDVPRNVKIVVERGKLYINGNVGEGSELSADVPEVWGVGSYPSVCYSLLLDAPYPCVQTTRVFEGRLYKEDNDPAVIVDGYANKGVVIQSNRDIVHIRDGSAKDVKITVPRHIDTSPTVSNGRSDGYFVSPAIH